MAIKLRVVLKTLFERGDRPKQADFYDWLESFFHLTENTTDDITEGDNKFVTSSEKLKIAEIDGKANAEHSHSYNDLSDLPTLPETSDYINVSDLKAPENISSQCDGANLVFTTAESINKVLWVSLNGGMLIEGLDFGITGGSEITLTITAPLAGETLYIKYI